MVKVFDVDANDLIEFAKEELKKNEALAQPEWALFAKSGVSRERPPEQEDFWYIRAAALLRKLYVKGPIGISRLRTEYGGRKNRGSRPEHHYPSGGKIIRVLLQQLEKAGYVKKGKKGREITPAGIKFLDSIAFKVSKTPKVEKHREKEIRPEIEKIDKEKAKEKKKGEGEIKLVEPVKKKK
ncbi:TPA: 30S ribosomal protein S19e [archaeon]|uniref:Small ribosomal subunit protein eS19 n=1 Tax=Candidatus Naiadarchaeum limnaeum TaxID=2756139 RepID=A0A832X6K4_9ARCH|nr:30S ribosomal protein S19e [Candidatus Naiadarchaeum limnaeum]